MNSNIDIKMDDLAIDTMTTDELKHMCTQLDLNDVGEKEDFIRRINAIGRNIKNKKRKTIENRLKSRQKSKQNKRTLKRKTLKLKSKKKTNIIQVIPIAVSTTQQQRVFFVISPEKIKLTSLFAMWKTHSKNSTVKTASESINGYKISKITVQSWIGMNYRNSFTRNG